jgi:YidC/Oxa1 family membrane protein insertase
MLLAVFGPLQAIIDVFEEVLLFFHDTFSLSWGLSIIALTLTVRLVLFPLTYKQFKSMRALQVLAPEMKKLQEKYKDDRQRLNQEMMKFYQENKVNPFGSCLPLLLQMPVFIALFYMLRKDLKVDICGPESQIAKTAKELGKKIADTGCDKVDPGSATFGFISDLTAPATGGVLVALLAMYVASQLLSSLLMSTTVDKNQRYLMLALPFLFVLFVKGFPAGLLVYWITTNVWTVGQGYIMRRNAPAPPPPPDKGGSKPARGKPVTPAPAGAAAAVASPSGGGGSAAAPPPPPRKKKKRSGRRR